MASKYTKIIFATEPKNLYTREIKKFDEIQFLRGFAILAVIAIHTTVNYANITKLSMLLITNVVIFNFSKFAVPLFIFISGFVLSINYKGLFSKKTFYKKRAISIIPSYIFYSILYILFNIILSAINGSLKFPSLIEIIYHFLTATSYYHLWFFVLITQFYIFYPYIINLYDNFKTSNKTFLFIVFVLIIQQAWLIIKDVAVSYTYYNNIFNSKLIYIIVKGFFYDFFFGYVFYFIIGIYVCQNYEYALTKLSNAKKFILIIMMILTGMTSVLKTMEFVHYGSESVSNIPTSYSVVIDVLYSIYFPFIFAILLLISLNLVNINNKYFNYSKIIFHIGKNSFGIYLIHPLYLTILVTLIFPKFGVDFNQMIFYPALFILTLILSYFSVYLTSLGLSHLKSKR